MYVFAMVSYFIFRCAAPLKKHINYSATNIPVLRTFKNTSIILVKIFRCSAPFRMKQKRQSRGIFVEINNEMRIEVQSTVIFFHIHEYYRKIQKIFVRINYLISISFFHSFFISDSRFFAAKTRWK